MLVMLAPAVQVQMQVEALPRGPTPYPRPIFPPYPAPFFPFFFFRVLPPKIQIFRTPPPPPPPPADFHQKPPYPRPSNPRAPVPLSSPTAVLQLHSIAVRATGQYSWLDQTWSPSWRWGGHSGISNPPILRLHLGTVDTALLWLGLAPQRIA